MPTLTIYHNPKCSKSRETLKVLQEKQNDKNGKPRYEVDIVRYQDSFNNDDITKDILLELKNTLHPVPESFKDAPWKCLLRKDVQKQAQSWDDAFDLVLKSTAAFERPFVIDRERKVSALGRPDTSAIFSLLEHYTKDE